MANSLKENQFLLGFLFWFLFHFFLLDNIRNIISSSSKSFLKLVRFVPFDHFIEVVSFWLVSGGGTVESTLDLHGPGDCGVVGVDEVQASWDGSGWFDVISEIDFRVALLGGDDVVLSVVEFLDFTESKVVILGALSVFPFFKGSFR